jgi:thymidylate kinase
MIESKFYVDHILIKKEYNVAKNYVWKKMCNQSKHAIQGAQVIAFLGPVGAGKSTQIRLLAFKLSNQGLKVKITSLKTNELFASGLVHVLARLLSIKRCDVFLIRGLIEDKPRIFKKLFKLWLFLDLISVHIVYLCKVYIPTIMGYTVIVEEYLPASIADYIYLSKALNIRSKFLYSTLIPILRLFYLRSSTMIFFLDTYLDELKFRWKHRGSLIEKTDYIHMQRTTLLSLSKKLSSHEVLHVNTTNQTIRKTHEVIVNHLTKF